MKKVKVFSLILSALLVLLLTGCFGPVFDMPKGTDEENQPTENESSLIGNGSLSVSLFVPDYNAEHEKLLNLPKLKIIHPQTNFIEIYLDEEYFATLSATGGEYVEHNGYFGVVYQNSLTVPAKNFGSVEAYLYDQFGNILTYGIAYEVNIPVGGNGTADIRSYPWYFTDLSITSEATYGEVQQEGMTYYRFYASAETTYTVSVIPGSITPDYYFFGPDALRTGTTDGTDYLFTNYSNYTIERTFPSEGYYWIGVYGYGGSGDYTVSVSTLFNPVNVYLTYGGSDPFDSSHPIVIILWNNELEELNTVKATSDGWWSVTPSNPSQSGYSLVFNHDLNNNWDQLQDIDDPFGVYYTEWANNFYPAFNQFSTVYPGDFVSATFTPLPADVWEPDNYYYDANYMNVGIESAQTNRIIHDGSDVDWVYFYADEGKTYIIETFSVGGIDVDTYLELYQYGTNLLTDNDDWGETFYSQIVWEAPYSDYFYVKVRGYGNTSVGDYGLSITVAEGGLELILQSKEKPDNLFPEGGKR